MTTDELQTALNKLESTVKGESSLPTIIVSIIALAGGWWLKYQLSVKAKELADARTALETEQEKAKEAAASAANAAIQVQVDAKLADATAALAAHEKLEDAHLERVKQLNAITNWDDLNKAAGIK